MPTTEPRDPGWFRWWRLYAHARGKGLTEAAARAYATLSWWGEWYGIEAPEIVSGKRSRAEQERLYRAYLEGRSRLPAAPPGASAHETGEAWDVRDNGALHVYGAWAPAVGARWGASFRDPVHFDLRG